jgi:hypothetical protein
MKLLNINIEFERPIPTCLYSPNCGKPRVWHPRWRRYKCFCEEHAAQNNAKGSARYHRLKAQGLCAWCGKEKVERGTKYCSKHLKTRKHHR